MGCAHGVDPTDPNAVKAGGKGGGFPGSGSTGAGGDDLGAGGSGNSSGSSSGSGASPGGGTTSSGGTSVGGGESAGGTQPGGGASNMGGSGGGAVVVDPVLPGDLIVQYYPGQMDTGSIRPQLAIVNRGMKNVPLSQLTIRYWYTADGPSGTGSQEAHLDYAEIGRLTNGRTTVKLSTGAVMPPQTGADTYLEVGFTGPDKLGPGQVDVDKNPLVSTKQIQTRVNWPNYSTKYNETNDYSYAMKTMFVDWAKVTLYQAGVLVFGTEPDGTKPSGAVPDDGGTTPTPADAGHD